MAVLRLTIGGALAGNPAGRSAISLLADRTAPNYGYYLNPNILRMLSHTSAWRAGLVAST